MGAAGRGIIVPRDTPSHRYRTVPCLVRCEAGKGKDANTRRQFPRDRVEKASRPLISTRPIIRAYARHTRVVVTRSFVTMIDLVRPVLTTGMDAM